MKNNTRSDCHRLLSGALYKCMARTTVYSEMRTNIGGRNSHASTSPRARAGWPVALLIDKFFKHMLLPRITESSNGRSLNLSGIGGVSRVAWYATKRFHGLRTGLPQGYLVSPTSNPRCTSNKGLMVSIGCCFRYLEG